MNESSDVDRDSDPIRNSEITNKKDLLRWVDPNAPPEIRKLFLAVFSETKITSSYRGPLPPAEEFRKYNEVEEGAAHRILQMAERSIEIEGEPHKIARRRINASTITAFGTISLSGLSIWQGLDPVVIVPLGLGGIISLFFREIIGLLRNRGLV